MQGEPQTGCQLSTPNFILTTANYIYNMYQLKTANV